MGNTPIYEFQPGAWKVRSASHPTLFHTVRETGGHLTCTCPAGTTYRFRRSDRLCRHMRQVMETPVASDRRPETPVRDPGSDDPFAGMPAPSRPASRPKASLLSDPHDGDPFYGPAWMPEPALDELEFAA